MSWTKEVEKGVGRLLRMSGRWKVERLRDCVTATRKKKFRRLAGLTMPAKNATRPGKPKPDSELELNNGPALPH